MSEEFDSTPIQRLSRDLATAAVTLSDKEARFLVDAYYTMQDNRIRAAAQEKSLDKDGDPHGVLSWLKDQNSTLEKQIQRALDRYSTAHPVGEWLRSNKGIGPVIAAGMLAHIDIHKAPTVGHIWRFAGLDPTSKWGKGEKRPWNTALKVLCWKAGESFVKLSNDPECYYGGIWRQRKDFEIARNDSGQNAELAARILVEKKFNKSTDAFKHLSAGHLPPAQIHARARRYAVKLLLSHLHHEMYIRILKQNPPFPYPIAHLGHVHFIAPPNGSAPLPGASQ